MKTNFICVNEVKDRKYVEHPDYVKAQTEAIRLHQKEGDSIKIYKLIAEVKRSTEYVIEKAKEKEIFIPTQAYIDSMEAEGIYWYDDGWHKIPKYGHQPYNNKVRGDK